MIPCISHAFLQGYWWMIISLLGGLLLFLMFVQGGQSMIFTLTRNNVQRTLLVNALGRKWELTFTTLVTFGGAFFASFPLFYATSFGGAYWLWMSLLFSFILQAVAYEFRSKPSNIFGTTVYDAFLFINGCVGPFLIGVAVSSFFTGSDFTLDVFNKVTWGNRLHGLEALSNPLSLLLGFSVLFLSRTLAVLYIFNSIDDEELIKNNRTALIYNSLPFLVFFVAFVILLFAGKGYEVSPSTGVVKAVDSFYLHKLSGSLYILFMFLAAVILVLAGIVSGFTEKRHRGIWYSGAGAVLAGMSLFFLAGYGNSAFYPSYSDPGSSLTLAKASSSLFTLKTMMYVSFIIPFVIAYIWVAWKAVSSRKIDEAELGEGGHIY